MAIILYLGFIIGLICLEKLGQRDLNKKNNAQICKKTYFKPINHQVDFNEI